MQQIKKEDKKIAVREKQEILIIFNRHCLKDNILLNTYDDIGTLNK